MKWLRRVRGAVGMGLTWAAAWAVGGVLIGVTSLLLPDLPWHTFFAFYDAPLPTLAIPGFVCGASFSVVLGIAGRHRRFDELSLPLFAAWGALGGLLLGLVMVALLAGGPGRDGPPYVMLSLLTAAISGPLAILGAASASASLLIARKAEKRTLLDADAAAAGVGLSDVEMRALLGGRGEQVPSLRNVRAP